MTATHHITTVPLADPELSNVSYNACIAHDPKQAFEAGFAIANYLHKKSMALVKKINANQKETPDSPAPQQDAPAIPMPTPTMMLAATPPPVGAEEAPSDEDPFAEFRSNQNQTTAHHA